MRDVSAAMGEAGFDPVRVNCAHCVSYPSGWWTFTLGAKGVDPAEEFREAAAAARGFPTRYYNERVHRGSFMLPTAVAELVA